MTDLSDLKIEIFADGANIDEMIELASRPLIKGLTTNPTLMRKAGVKDYRNFASKILKNIKDKPISFEIFSENLDEMILQGREVGSWAENVYVKVPITNSAGVETFEVIKILSSEGVKVNVTAIMTIDQVVGSLEAISENTPSYLSVFAGRIADTGRDPVPIIHDMLEISKKRTNTKFIWASPRELLNIFQANSLGCHVITATKEILDKLQIVGKSLEDYSLETVRMFQEDARKSGYRIGSI